MRVLLDENFPVSATAVVSAAGYEVIPFTSVCAYGASDEEVFRKAQELDAVILTSDRDFYHTMPLLHPAHHGIIVLSLRQPNRRAICERLAWFFNQEKPPFANKVFALRDCTYRVR